MSRASLAERLEGQLDHWWRQCHAAAETVQSTGPRSKQTQRRRQPGNSLCIGRGVQRSLRKWREAGRPQTGPRVDRLHKARVLFFIRCVAVIAGWEQRGGRYGGVGLVLPAVHCRGTLLYTAYALPSAFTPPPRHNARQPVCVCWSVPHRVRAECSAQRKRAARSPERVPF